jgi:predicted metal-dependent peptidase
LDQLKRIAQVKTRLVECMPFFGRLVLYLKPRLARFEDSVISMSVAPDGTLVVNEKFCEALDDPELAAVLVHEILHVALLYWDRIQNRLPLLFNEAHDYAINLIIYDIQNINIYLPNFLLLNHEFDNLSAEEIYDLLFKKRKSIKDKDRPLRYDCRVDLAKDEIPDWKSIVKDALQFYKQVGRGDLPKGLYREISGILEPQVDWLEKLKRFIGEFGRRSVYSYVKPSNRSESSGEFLPSLQRSSPQVTILVDTSSSISKESLTLAISEINSICTDLSTEVRVIIIDAKIHEDIKISDISNLKLSGMGGSNFIPAFNLLESECYSGVVIAMTDGDINVPETKPECIREVIWMVGENDNLPTEKWGEVVRVSSDIF